MRLLFIAVASLGMTHVAMTHVAGAQSCPPASPNQQAGTRPDAPWFDYEVDKAARFITTDTSRSYPDDSFTSRKPVSSPDLFLIQFVLDTMGVPSTTTLKILKTPYNVTTDSVRVLAQRWRYTQAVARGCKVAQLVQTPLRWR